jgi:hypothetical protein
LGNNFAEQAVENIKNNQITIIELTSKLGDRAA